MRNGGAGVANTLGGTLVCSVLFYLITNTFCWATEAIHAKTLEGWVQCLVTGTPGLPPTWVFFRNSLMADLIGAGALLLVYNGEAVMRGVRGMPWIAKRETMVAVA
jgi:hypothetical protein